MAPRPRSELQTLLEGLLGSSNVYFQPPPTVRLEYPCITYTRETIRIAHADNAPYRHSKRYLITVIDRDPDSKISEKVAELPTVQFGRSYASDYLNHDTYRIYF